MFDSKTVAYRASVLSKVHLPYDIQAQNVYKAEDEAYNPWKAPRITFAEAREFIHSIQSSAWMLKHYPEYAKGPVQEIAPYKLSLLTEVTEGVLAATNLETGIIELPNVNPIITKSLLHEISHAIILAKYGFEAGIMYQGHGPEFAKVNLEVFNQFAPELDLAKHYAMNGVKVADVPRLYESTGYLIVPCPCGDDGCEVEVETRYGLDIPWHVTKVPDRCSSDDSDWFTFTKAEKDQIVTLASEINDKDNERRFDSQYE